MASRPAKRQRRGPFSRTDKDDNGVPTVDVALRTPKKQTKLELGSHNGSPLTFSPSPANEKAKKAASSKTSTTTSTTNSPKKSNKSGPKRESDKNTTLSSFFSKVGEDQRWFRRVATPELDTLAGDEDDVIVDDEISDDALLSIDVGQLNNNTTNTVLDRRKVSHKDLGTKKTIATRQPSPLPSSQRFKKVAAPTKPSSTGHRSDMAYQDESNHRPWADRYAPTSLEELAVHKKKVQDVQMWLDDALSSRHRQRLLLLKGPAGSGKSATISVLASVLGFQPISWQNPVGYGTSGAGSVSVQFDDFLNRGAQFGSLSFEDDDAPTLHRNTRPILLVEEFPAFTQSSGVVESFRKVIQHFLARPLAAPTAPHGAQKTNKSAPLVMIVSETLLSSSTALSESFTAHRLLGPEILNHSLVNVIEFNPVAPTFIGKALDLVIRKEARESGRRRIPGPAVIQHLADMGDVRNAVNTLEFLCIRNLDSDWSGTVASRQKKSKAGTSMTDMERNSLRLLCRRETTLDMFHAAGKIMHNKRDAPGTLDSPTDPPPKPPDYLMQHHRPRVSQVDIDALLNETGTDIQTFISTLHENYVLSCNGGSFVDSMEACSDMLSVSDILNPDSRRQFSSRSGLNSSTALQANIGATSSDALRQDELSFHVATRGLLFHLPYPVKRAGMSYGRRSDPYKMFYPVNLRLWRRTEEIESLIGLFASSAALLPMSKKSVSSGGVATWQTPSFGFSTLSTMGGGGGDAAVASGAHESQTGRPFPPKPNHDELVLDILPHLALIQANGNHDDKNSNQADMSRASASALLQKIVRFNGNGIDPSDLQEQEQEEDQVSESTSSTSLKSNLPTTGTTGKRGGNHNSNTGADIGNGAGLGLGLGLGVDMEMDKEEQLFLEDDDIVDDD